MESTKETIENKNQEFFDELDENSFMCLIVKSLSDVYIRYDV